MKTVNIGNLNDLPAIAVGCMRIHSLEEKQAAEFVSAAVENGLNFFDHADIYGRGKSETVFSKACKDAGKTRGYRPAIQMRHRTRLNVRLFERTYFKKR